MTKLQLSSSCFWNNNPTIIVHPKLMTSHHVILVSVDLPPVEQCRFGCASQSGPGVWAATRRSPQDLYSAREALGHGLLEASPSEQSAAGHLHNSKKTGLRSKIRIKNHTKLLSMQNVYVLTWVCMVLLLCSSKCMRRIHNSFVQRQW